MTKSELNRAVASNLGLSISAVVAVTESFLGMVRAAVHDGQTVTLDGIGKLVPKTRPARKSRNPKTGAVVDVPAKRVLSFRRSKYMQDSLNQSRPIPQFDESLAGASEYA